MLTGCTVSIVVMVTLHLQIRDIKEKVRFLTLEGQVSDSRRPPDCNGCCTC